jgi:hypothetical protein
MKKTRLLGAVSACLSITPSGVCAYEAFKKIIRSILSKTLILSAGTLLLSGAVQASLIGDSVQGYISTTSTISYVATQFNSPAVVNNTGLPEFTGNFHYEYNTTTGPVIYEFDLMLDVGDNYFEFWMQPTNDWGNTGSFSSSGTIFTVSISDIDAGGPIDNVSFDPYHDTQEYDEFGFPLEQWDPTWGTLGWSDNSVSFGFHGATDSGEHFRYYFTEGATVVPVPAAIWLFGSGLAGLIGVSRRKNLTVNK